jgi:hypothetical protein
MKLSNRLSQDEKSNYATSDGMTISQNVGDSSLPMEAISFLDQLKYGIWLLGIPCWLFGIVDRGLAAFADGSFSGTELSLAAMASFLFMSWLFLKPEPQAPEVATDPVVVDYYTPFDFQPASAHLEATQTRMAELHHYHLISQSYILPFPYLCQIYHLLNLKHLETIHSFSLNNLKVVKVSHLEQTDQGGMVKFQTILDSPWNVLRIWRQPIAEALLTLHTPYTVELAIPVYGDKVIIVMFNTFPLGHTEHQFCVDIYSNLEWYKPFLKFVLHFASLLTLLEDLPYLRALAQTNVQRLFNINKPINHEMVWLLGRFIKLYGSSWGSASSRVLPDAGPASPQPSTVH